jgi:protein phosphatase
VQLSVAARTDIGMIRAGNEDSFYADANQFRGLFIVADGMGGHAAGEVASEMAVQIVTKELASVQHLNGDDVAPRVAAALRNANRAIFLRTVEEVDKQGMGTTASVLILANDRYLIGQVGDSRVYLLRDGMLRQLTKDHSYVQEQVDAGFLTPEQARYHPYSNVITRCVGASESVEPDTYGGVVKAGDIFLVASDGLTGMVDDRRLQQLLQARSSPGRLVDSLIAEANGRGGLDNITAIVIQVSALDEQMNRETPAAGAPTLEVPTYPPGGGSGGKR